MAEPLEEKGIAFSYSPPADVSDADWAATKANVKRAWQDISRWLFEWHILGGLSAKVEAVATAPNLSILSVQSKPDSVARIELRITRKSPLSEATLTALSVAMVALIRDYCGRLVIVDVRKGSIV